MKKIIKYVLCGLLLAGCSEDFLIKTPNESVSTGSAVKDIPSMTAAMNGVYSSLQDADYYGRTLPLVPELVSDNVFVSFKNAGRYIDYDRFVVRATDGFVATAWRDMYVTMAGANKVINDGEALELNPTLQEQADQMIGEAYAIRGLVLFDLCRLFAQPYNFAANGSHMGVPIVLESDAGIQQPARSTVAECYTQIISDLQKAITMMSEDTGDGRFSINGAKALLARVYLYKEEWQLAADMATEVINTGDYTFISNANYVASWHDDFTSESIMEVVNTQTDNAGTDAIGYFYNQTGYGDGLSTQDLYDSYAATDVRQGLITVGVRASGEDPAYIINKYDEREDNFRVIRLPELYLIRAEALAELGGANETAALTDLNTIIKQRDPSAADFVGTGQALIDRVVEERRKELAFEGHRLFDLNRKKKDVNIIQTDDVIAATYPNDRFVLPIPQNELDANPGIDGQQNPGY